MQVLQEWGVEPPFNSVMEHREVSCLFKGLLICIFLYLCDESPTFLFQERKTCHSQLLGVPSPVSPFRDRSAAKSHLAQSYDLSWGSLLGDMSAWGYKGQPAPPKWGQRSWGHSSSGSVKVFLLPLTCPSLLSLPQVLIQRPVLNQYPIATNPIPDCFWKNPVCNDVCHGDKFFRISSSLIE